MRALLFDLDGTLADTDRLHEQAWLETLRSYGIEGDHHFYQTQISGGLNPEIVRRLLPQLSEAEREAFIARKAKSAASASWPEAYGPYQGSTRCSRGLSSNNS
jgi:beta-phosphoglucomutase-like phosphatase (HAD superfamily)